MDNLEKLWCHSVTTNEKEYGKSIACSYAEDIACFITDRNYLCTYQHYKLTSKAAAKRIQGNGKLKHIHYLSFYDTIFCATDFDFYIFGRHTFQIKFCFVTHKRIVKLCWNPSETAVVVVFESNDIAIFDFSGCKFEQIYTTDLHADISNSVHVGWGSERTQFQGPSSQESTENVDIVDMYYEPPTISWRNQGEQFAVNYFKDGKRFVKVFDKELTALYMSSEYINLGAPMSFMTLGQCIAGCAIRNNVNTIVIFEKNCKMRTYFRVPESKGEIRKLEYHPHMNMLAVYSIDNQKSSYINIYLKVNGKWYLKHQLFFPPNRRVRDFQWINMPEAAFTVCKMVVFTSKNVEYHTFRFIINRMPRKSVTAVINGPAVDFYNFADKTVPPPMRFCTMTFYKPVNQVLFHPTLPLAVVLNSKFQAFLVDVRQFCKLCDTEDLRLPNIATFHSVSWNVPSRIEINIAYNSNERRIASKCIPGLVLEVRTFQMTKPEYVLPYNDTISLISHKILDERFCSLMYLTKKIVSVDDCNMDVDFSLSSNHECFVDEKLLIRGITSLLIFKGYMFFTYVDSKLYCLRLPETRDMLLNIQLDLPKIFSRDIEQGQRIVNYVDGDHPQLILQAPRGNLESVECRLMTVDVVDNLLRRNDWKAAIDVMRIGKINWNILVDLDPQRFAANVGDFTKAATHCSILSSIVNEFGVIDKNYHLYLPESAQVLSDRSELILAILDYLITTNCTANLVPIVAIQHRHISVRAALCSIKEVFETKEDDSEVMCKRALQYLLLKEHFKDIICAAYTLYNLEFLAFIYAQSAEDPRVYGPEMTQLRSLNQVELRFKLNLKAYDPKNALKYLLRCDAYDISYIESFIVKHKLEAIAYRSMPQTYKYQANIGTLYANYLSQQGRHSEAAFVLSGVKLFPQAIKEHVRALNWMEVISLMEVLEYSKPQKLEVLYDLSEQLLKARKLYVAVFVLEHYAEDYEKVIEVLVDHKEFMQAIGFARIHGLCDVIEENILPNLTAYTNNLNEKIEEHGEMFEKYLKRLKEVREAKKKSLDNQSTEVYEPDDVVSDSDSTSSESSRGSSITRGSNTWSRNRRKEERKKIDLRRGGYYEDIALIRILHLTYTDVFGMGPEVRDVCLIADYPDVEQLQKIHKKLSQLQEYMKKQVGEIWPDVFVTPPHNMDNTILAIVHNKRDLDPRYQNPPSEDLLNIKWKWELFSSTF